MERLAMIMKVQAIAFLGYAIGWLLAPDFVNGTVLGWETETLWPRMTGGMFLAIAWGEWRVIEHLHERLDLVWMFAAIPIALFVALLWEQLAGTYSGSDTFMVVSVGVTVVFGAAVSTARSAVKPGLVST